MQPPPDQRGRQLLIVITLLAVALQLAKLGSRGLVLNQWPTVGQWGQVGLVVWLLIFLWEGKEWARIACAVYYGIAAGMGVVAIYMMWPKVDTSLKAVSIVMIVLAALVSGVLWFSETVSSHLAERRAG